MLQGMEFFAIFQPTVKGSKKTQEAGWGSSIRKPLGGKKKSQTQYGGALITQGSPTETLSTEKLLL